MPVPFVSYFRHMYFKGGPFHIGTNHQKSCVCVGGEGGGGWEILEPQELFFVIKFLV